MRFRSVAVWFLFIAAESLNGAIRTLWLAPLLGEQFAHQISFAIGSGLVLAIATLCIRWIRAWQMSQLIAIGFLWVILTLMFEISLGRFVLGYSWNRIAADYNLLEGGLMPLGLVLLAVAPMIAAKIRGGQQLSK